MVLLENIGQQDTGIESLPKINSAINKVNENSQSIEDLRSISNDAPVLFKTTGNVFFMDNSMNNGGILYRSVDGFNWEHSIDFIEQGSRVTSIVETRLGLFAFIIFNNPTRITSNIFHSSDEGRSWNVATDGIMATGNVIETDFGLYISDFDRHRNARVYQSDDGLAWRQVK